MNLCCAIFYWLTIFNWDFDWERVILSEPVFPASVIGFLGRKDIVRLIEVKQIISYDVFFASLGVRRMGGNGHKLLLNCAFPTTQSKLHLLHVHVLIVCLSLYKTNELFNKVLQCVVWYTYDHKNRKHLLIHFLPNDT